MPKVALVIFSILVIITCLVIIVSFIANLLFNEKVTLEVKELFKSNSENQKEVITKADLAGLPQCVQKWLEYSQVIGKERIRTVRLKQNGLMRTKEDGRWMPAQAEQYFTIDEPGFIWKANVQMAPLLSIAGRDKYYEGKGNMLIKLLALITLADARGKELDQGTLLRYLGETMWFPTAALSNYITWEGIDSNSARATMSYRGVSASAVFEFNEKGEVIKIIGKRYMAVNDKYMLETWSVPLRDYKEFNGIRIPTKGEVIWNLKTGDFSYFQFEITEIEYNQPKLY